MVCLVMPLFPSRDKWMDKLILKLVRFTLWKRTFCTTHYHRNIQCQPFKRFHSSVGHLVSITETDHDMCDWYFTGCYRIFLLLSTVHSPNFFRMIFLNQQDSAIYFKCSPNRSEECVFQRLSWVNSYLLVASWRVRAVGWSRWIHRSYLLVFNPVTCSLAGGSLCGSSVNTVRSSTIGCKCVISPSMAISTF